MWRWYWRYQNLILESFKDLKKIHFSWKLRGCGLKFELAMPYSVLNFFSLFDRSSFLSHAIEISKNGKDIIWTSLKMYYFLKLQGRGSKIEPAMPFSILSFENLKWVWQAHFLSHTPVTVENCVSLIDVEMILIIFFDTRSQKLSTWRFPFSVPIHNPHPV